MCIAPARVTYSFARKFSLSRAIHVNRPAQFHHERMACNLPNSDADIRSEEPMLKITRVVQSDQKSHCNWMVRLLANKGKTPGSVSMNKSIEFEILKPVRRRVMIKKRLGRARCRTRKAMRQITETAALVQLVKANIVSR
jgi:hypothetical protein